MRQTALRITAIVSAVILGQLPAYAQQATPGEETPAIGAQSRPAGSMAAHMSDPVSDITADHSKF